MRIKGVALIVVVSLLGTALAMAFSGKDDTAESVVEAVSKSHASATQEKTDQNPQAQPDTLFDLSSIKRKSPKPSSTSELFQSKSWFVAPPPQQQIASFSPPPPSAPQLSFTFIGRLIDDNQVTLFLTKNGRQYSVKVGDVMDEVYRVDTISNTNALLTYLPMSMQQTLTFNSTAIGAPTSNVAVPNATLQAILPVIPQISAQ